MEILVSLSTILKDIVKDVEDEKTKEDFAIEHIRNVTKNYFSELQFPQGKDWFNVSKPLTENHLRGKVVVLDFFTYCCINCLHLIPHLRALEENFSVADGVVVIGVHSAKFENEKNSSNIAAALKRHNITHPVINDSNSYMWDKLKISCWPTIVIIGPEGHALFVLVGEQCREELFLYVKSTLKYYSSSISPHTLPITSCNDVVSSSILKFPGKISRFENVLAVADSGNHRILVVDERGNIRFKIGGTSPGFKDGSLKEARFNSPQGIAFYNKIEIYVADTENHAIRLIDLNKLKVVTVAGTGVQGTDYIGGKTGLLQDISSPWDLCFVPSIHVKDSASHSSIICGSPDSSIKAPNPFTNLPPPPPPPPPKTPGNVNKSIPVPPPPPAVGKLPEQTVDRTLVVNNVLLIAMSGIHQIWALFLSDTTWWKGKKYAKNTCVAIAGSGKEENRNNSYPMMSSFAQPSGLAYSPQHKAIFIADSESSSIRRLSLEDGSVSHVVGGDKNPVDLFNYGDVDGKGFNAKLQHPLGVTCSLKENAVYVCDTYNNKVKKIDLSTSNCCSVNVESDTFNEPSGCVLDDTEEVLYVADTNNNSIAVFNLVDNTVGQLVIKESDSDCSAQMNENSQWNVETEVSTKGGTVTLVVQLEPNDIHGSWKLDIASPNLESDRLKGRVTSEPDKLVLRVLPTEKTTTDTADIHFNLAFCERDVCLFKKCALRLNITRSPNGRDAVKLEFRKVVS